jgi:hypothetical protein
MFDSEGRLVIANDRYAKMHGLAPEDAQPGTPTAGYASPPNARGWGLNSCANAR